MRCRLALLTLLACGSHPAAVLAQPDLVEITVRRGDTCRGIAARLYGDPDAYPRLHEHNPQLGPMPHRLRPGTTLRVPRATPPARLSAVRRRVERRPPSAASFAPARAGHPLPRGTQVRTHDGASAIIRFADREQVQIRERTLVIIWGGQRQLTRRPLTRAELERGALRSRLSELAGGTPLRVQTPTSTASLRGAGVVTVAEDGTSRVANHGRREATVEAHGGWVTLPAGTGTVVRRGRRPTRPRRLLPAPRWRADRTGPVIGFVGRGATLSGGWDPVRGADRYRVEVATRPGGVLIATQETGGAGSRFEVDGLPEGIVYVSVASIDGDGLEGRRSPWRAFGVRLARLVEPGGEPVEADGRAPRVWPGTWFVAPRGLDCALDHGGRLGPAGGILTLARAGRNVLSCHDAHGNILSPLEVDVLSVVLRTSANIIVRDRRTVLPIEIVAPRIPPPSVLVVTASDGFRVDAVRARTDGRPGVDVDLWSDPDAPDTASVVVAVASGAERVPLGRLALPVRSPAAAGGEQPSARREASAPVRPAVQSAFGDVAWPSLLSLRDERRGGLEAWLYGAGFTAPQRTPTDPSPDPQLRVGVGARAQVPGTPLRVEFGTQLDVLARPGAVGRRGDGDVVAGLGAELYNQDLLGLAVDLTAWFPTRARPPSIDRVRLAPSVEASWRALPALTLRTRQGALIDATGSGARLYAFAVGVDFALLPWLSLGAELDGAAGRFADRDGAALTLGGGAEARLGWFSVAIGARFALTDEARALAGDGSGVLTVRLATD